MADVINTLQFLEERCFIVIFGILPFDGVADWSFETAFPSFCFLVAHMP
jgi:hypothetical protein